MRGFAWIVAVLFGVFLSGCASYEIKKLVEGGKYDAAADYWVANKEALAKSSDSTQMLAPIAKGLGDKLGAQVPATIAALEAITAVPNVVKGQLTQPARNAVNAQRPTHWSTQPSQWSNIRSQLANADKLVQQTKSHPFFVGQPALMPAWVDRLHHAAQAAKGRIIDGTAFAFLAYDHRSPQPFFDLYPIPIQDRTKAALTVRGAPLWMTALLGGNEQQAKSIVKTFYPQLRSEAARNTVASSFATVVARERRWGDTRSLQQIVQLMQALDDAGLDASPAAAGIQVVIVRGLGAAGDAFTWQTTDRLASRVQAHNLPLNDLVAWIAEIERLKPNQMFLLVDASRVSGTWNVKDVARRARQREIGKRQENNPEYDKAAEALEEARNELSSAEQSDAQIQAQAQRLAAMSPGSSTAMLSVGMGKYLLVSAQNKVSQAERTLAQTPRTVTKPVIQPYQVAVSNIETMRKHEVGVYLVDGARAQFSKLQFRDTSSPSSTLVFGLDPRDPEHAAEQKKNTEVREQLRRTASGGGRLGAADVWRRLVSVAPSTEVAPLDALMQTLKADLDRWGSEAQTDRANAEAAEQQLEQRILRIVQNQN